MPLITYDEAFARMPFGMQALMISIDITHESFKRAHRITDRLFRDVGLSANPFNPSADGQAAKAWIFSRERAAWNAYRKTQSKAIRRRIMNRLYARAITQHDGQLRRELEIRHAQAERG